MSMFSNNKQSLQIHLNLTGVSKKGRGSDKKMGNLGVIMVSNLKFVVAFNIWVIKAKH